MKSEGCPDDLTVYLCYPCHTRTHGRPVRLVHPRGAVSAALKRAHVRRAEAGLTHPSGGRYITDVDKMLIISMRQAGCRIADIAQRLGCSNGSVSALLSKAGLSKRIRPQAVLSDSDRAEWPDLYKAEWPCHQIADTYGCSYSAVRRHLIESGVTMRPRSFRPAKNTLPETPVEASPIDNEATSSGAIGRLSSGPYTLKQPPLKAVLKPPPSSSVPKSRQPALLLTAEAA